VHINFTVFESSCGVEIVRAEGSSYKRENIFRAFSNMKFTQYP